MVGQEKSQAEQRRSEKTGRGVSGEFKGVVEISERSCCDASRRVDLDKGKILPVLLRVYYEFQSER